MRPFNPLQAQMKLEINFVDCCLVFYCMFIEAYNIDDVNIDEGTIVKCLKVNEVILYDAMLIYLLYFALVCLSNS